MTGQRTPRSGRDARQHQREDCLIACAGLLSFGALLHKSLTLHRRVSSHNATEGSSFDRH
jgi:hypothetical protein